MKNNMATRKNDEVISESRDNLTLHEMFRVVGDQMTTREVTVLKILYPGILSDDMKTKVNDGIGFLFALEKLGRVDESNFKHLLHVLRSITRHDLLQFVSLRRRKTVKVDAVDKFLEETAVANIITPTKLKRKLSSPTFQDGCSAPATEKENGSKCKSFLHESETLSASTHTQNTNEGSPPLKRRREHTQRHLKKSSAEAKKEAVHLEEAEIKKKLTCDIRLRVRAEYCQHENALDGNIFSIKPELVERQFEKFMQANTILKSRDLGSIICDIKFSELTYLDAFWRDYINGSLLEALKGVFITESLKQAVGHEAIKLLVNVDEDDYEAGRLKLLQNLQD